jgi:hypothetical protein
MAKGTEIPATGMDMKNAVKVADLHSKPESESMTRAIPVSECTPPCADGMKGCK